MLAGPWIVLALAAALSLAAMRLRRTGPAPREDLRRAWPFALAAAAVAVGSAGAFAFHQDDFQYLVLARIDPFAVEPQRRLLGVQIPFLVARGSAAGHLALNGLAILALGSAVAALLRTGGWTRREAAIAALCLASSAPVVDLAPWGAGFQQLGAWAAVFGAAAAMNAEGGRAARLAAATGLSMLVVVIKWPLAPLAPALGWLFGALARGRAPHVEAAASAIGVGAALALVGPEMGSFRAGPSGVVANALDAGERLWDLLRPVAVALVAIAALTRPSRERLVGAFFLGRSARDTVRVALVLGLAALAPFLLNESYFAAYYLGPGLAFVAALGARLFVALAPSGRAGLALAFLLAVAWFPARAATERWTDPRYDVVRAGLADAARALGAAPAVDEVGVVARCDDAALDAIWSGGEGEWGLRWASGRLHTRFVRAPRPTTLVYCRGFHLEDGDRR